MPKVKLHPLIEEMSGTLGDVVFKRSRVKGEAILAKRPRKTNNPSEAQQAVWDRMKAAQAYATAALADPRLYAHYKARARKQKLQPRHVAIADFLQGKDLLSK